MLFLISFISDKATAKKWVPKLWHFFLKHLASDEVKQIVLCHGFVVCFVLCVIGLCVLLFCADQLPSICFVTHIHVCQYDIDV